MKPGFFRMSLGVAEPQQVEPGTTTLRLIPSVARCLDQLEALASNEYNLIIFTFGSCWVAAETTIADETLELHRSIYCSAAPRPCA